MLLLRCNKRRLQEDAQQAGSPPPALRTDPALSPCPEAPLPAKPGAIRDGEAAGAPQDEESVKRAERGRERSASLPAACAEPRSPQPGRSGATGGTRAVSPAFTLHPGVALALERSGGGPAVPWALPQPPLCPGCRGRYKYPRSAAPGRAGPAAPPAGQGERTAGRGPGLPSLPKRGVVAAAACDNGIVTLPLKPEPVLQSPAGAAGSPAGRQP